MTSFKSIQALFFSFLFFASACTETMEETMVNNVENISGKWQVESYTISGEEQMGSSILNFQMHFDPIQASSGNSIWEWTNGEGQANSTQYIYTLSSSASSIMMGGDSYELEISEDELQIFQMEPVSIFVTAKKL